MKICTKCGVEHSRKHSWCAACMAVYDRLRSQPDSKKMVQNRERRVKNRRFLYDYLTTHHCVDCGEKDPVVLQFDHVRGEKAFNISNGFQRGQKKLLAEIAKCEVRCANCHFRRTAKQFGWYARLFEE